MDRVTEENVIAELAGIAFDDGCNDGCGLVVKTADKLRALELLYKYLGLGDRGGGVDKVVIVDDVILAVAFGVPPPCGPPIERSNEINGHSSQRNNSKSIPTDP